MRAADSWEIPVRVFPHCVGCDAHATRTILSLPYSQCMSEKVDLLDTLERLRAELEGEVDPARRSLLLDILKRWQQDIELTKVSRERAGELVRRYKR